MPLDVIMAVMRAEPLSNGLEPTAIARATSVACHHSRMTI
jgi:hypothetical protein